MNCAEFIAVHYANLADLSNDLTDREETLGLAKEQTKNEEIKQAVEWNLNGLGMNLKYATGRLKKNTQIV